MIVGGKGRVVDQACFCHVVISKVRKMDLQGGKIESKVILEWMALHL